MPQQLSFLPTGDLKITPEPNREEPRFWVRKLVIWQDPATIIREITLRPGLNIIWSPDPADQLEQADESIKLGHGSGKTLFCRLLRYCLGEERFADENQRHRIASVFEQGMVGAEVIVDGTPWAVLRPVGHGRRHFAVPNSDLATLVSADMQATGIGPFLDAVEAAVLTRPVAELIRGNDPAMPWLLSLAWLTRDQECRFDDVLDWRSASSDSESPARALSKAERLAAMRALIGAIVPGEFTARQEVENLIRRRETAERESHHREWEASRLRARLITETEVAASDVPDGLLGVEVLRGAAKRLLARIAGVAPTVDVTNIDSLKSEVDTARNRSTALRVALREAEARIPVAEKLIQRLESEVPGASADAFSAQNPMCPVCEVPIDQALAEGCKVSHRLPDLAALQRRRDKLQEDLALERANLEADRANRLRVQHELEDALREVEERRATLDAAESAREKHAASWFKARRLIDDANHLGELLREYDQADVNVRDLELEIERRREQLGAFRDEQAQVFQKLSFFFDAIVSRLVHGATGKVALDGTGLKLSVELGGDRSTAAIDSLKVIAFDLAVMCMAVEGSIRLPAFLVHDSPREADLGLSVYHRLFELVHALERDTGHPLFQYIVTTTTPPPAELVRAPWLAETLRGTPAEARLLKQDL